jgi:hypothetical protein
MWKNVHIINATHIQTALLEAHIATESAWKKRRKADEIKRRNKEDLDDMDKQCHLVCPVQYSTEKVQYWQDSTEKVQYRQK